jgi:hypothetical protein
VSIELIRILAVAALVATACAADPDVGARAGQPTSAGVATVRSEDACPLTIPSGSGFTPPEPHPAQPPDLYEAIWYGTPALWTMLHPEGEVWTDLPKDHGAFSQKTLWWSDGFSRSAEPSPPIIVRGQQLDGPGSFGSASRGTNGFRHDIGPFMLVGIEVPAAGCWEVTASHGSAELTYVVLVEG